MSAPLSGMTGFGRADRAGDFGRIEVEARSVNGKGLDLKFRMPTGAEALEPRCRSEARSLHRGTVSLNLRVERDAETRAFQIDADALDVHDAGGIASVSAADFAGLGQRPAPLGVIRVGELLLVE